MLSLCYTNISKSRNSNVAGRQKLINTVSLARTLHLSKTVHRSARHKVLFTLSHRCNPDKKVIK